MDLHKYVEAPAAYPRVNAAQRPEQADRDESHAQARRDAVPVDAPGAAGRDGNNAVLERSDVERLVEQAREQLEVRGVELRFNVSEEQGRIQVEVRDPETDKVIRKIPEDELMRLSSHIKDFTGNLAGALAGTLMDRPI